MLKPYKLSHHTLLGRLLLVLVTASSPWAISPSALASPQEAPQDAAVEQAAEVDSTSEIGLLESPPESQSSTTDIKELNVPPKNMIPLYEKDRPEWLFKAPMIADGKLVLYVGGELCATAEECEKKQAAAMYADVCKYFDTEVFHESDAAACTPLTEEFIASRWVDTTENYLAKVQTSEGTMYQLWSIVRIDDEGLKTMKQWHLSSVQPVRIRTLGLGLVGVLGGIGLIHLGARFTSRRSRKKA